MHPRLKRRCVPQYERFKINEVKKRNLASKIVRKFPLVAACCHIRDRGINTYNESEVINRENSVQAVGGAASEREVNSDIDFTITLGHKSILCRAASREEKRLWVIALNAATTIRSFTCVRSVLPVPACAHLILRQLSEYGRRSCIGERQVSRDTQVGSVTVRILTLARNPAASRICISTTWTLVKYWVAARQEQSN